MGSVMNKKLLGNKVKPGHLIIINDIDCPKPMLVAVIITIKGKRVEALYLSDRANLDVCWASRPENVTPIEQFGVSAEYDGEKVVFNKNAESMATYSDGRARSWQGIDGGYLTKIRSRALAHAIGAAALNGD
jgi:hypothetical protein